METSMRPLEKKDEIMVWIVRKKQFQDLKQVVLTQVAEPITQRVVVPSCGLTSLESEAGVSVLQGSNMFRNATGVLRFHFLIIS